MPVVSGSLITYPSDLLPTNDTDPSGGTIDTAGGAMSEAATGVLFPTTPVPALEQGWRYKACRKNTHATDTFYDWVAYVLNGLAYNHTAGQVSVVSDDPAEVGKVKILVKVAGVWTLEDITLNGTTSALGALVADASTLVRGIKTTAGGARTPATGNISLTRGTLQGIIPLGYDIASAEFELGLDPTISSALQSANRLSDPAGVTFARAIAEASALTGPADLTAGAFWGYWLRWTRFANIPSPVGGYLRPLVAFRGSDAA